MVHSEILPWSQELWKNGCCCWNSTNTGLSNPSFYQIQPQRLHSLARGGKLPRQPVKGSWLPRASFGFTMEKLTQLLYYRTTLSEAKRIFTTAGYSVLQYSWTGSAPDMRSTFSFILPLPIPCLSFPLSCSTDVRSSLSHSPMYPIPSRLITCNNLYYKRRQRDYPKTEQEMGQSSPMLCHLFHTACPLKGLLSQERVTSFPKSGHPGLHCGSKYTMSTKWRNKARNSISSLYLTYILNINLNIKETILGPFNNLKDDKQLVWIETNHHQLLVTIRATMFCYRTSDTNWKSWKVICFYFLRQIESNQEKERGEGHDKEYSFFTTCHTFESTLN